jgi:hypothetical protein
MMKQKTFEGVIKRWIDKLNKALAAAEKNPYGDEAAEIEKLLAVGAEENRKKYPQRFKDAEEELARRYK